ncbi:MAG: glycosyltransferase [Pseudomonadales bacterium]
MATILMLCHDQHLDRRVVAQAQSLIRQGHEVQLLALAFDANGVEETTPEGIRLRRIGLNAVVPENPTYLGYTRRQVGLNNLLNRLANRWHQRTGLFQRGFNAASKLNWHLYRVELLARYRNRHLHDPLPFRQAFSGHAPAERPDAIQVHDLPALEAGVELAARWQVPLVYDAHELYPEQRSFSSVQRRLCAQAEARLTPRADLVFAVNESIAAEMARRYAIAKPVVLTNAIDPDPSFNPDAHYNLLREKTGLSGERRILLLQGGFAPHRNLEELVVAMRHVKTTNVDLVMMGFGDFGNRLREVATRIGLIDRRVLFLPAVPQSELLQHSASADLGIIPYPHVDLNSYFCTPNKLFEFIQAGLPILANDSPELRRYVETQHFGTLAPMRNAREIAHAIDDAFSHLGTAEWRLNLMRHRGEYTWKQQEIVYLQAMDKLLSTQKVVDNVGALTESGAAE